METIGGVQGLRAQGLALWRFGLRHGGLARVDTCEVLTHRRFRV